MMWANFESFSRKVPCNRKLPIRQTLFRRRDQAIKRECSEALPLGYHPILEGWCVRNGEALQKYTRDGQVFEVVDVRTYCAWREPYVFTFGDECVSDRSTDHTHGFVQ